MRTVSRSAACSRDPLDLPLAATAIRRPVVLRGLRANPSTSITAASREVRRRCAARMPRDRRGCRSSTTQKPAASPPGTRRQGCAVMVFGNHCRDAGKIDQPPAGKFDESATIRPCRQSTDARVSHSEGAELTLRMPTPGSLGLWQWHARPRFRRGHTSMVAGLPCSLSSSIRGSSSCNEVTTTRSTWSSVPVTR